ncbi:hypothetical protein [Sphingopyxis sp. SCN 67-31]|uniref:hypothetical protein n=1 Tax=Sphingopyxis sp. SCN 67-31 TaxID=1660142 RepID=UPI002580E6A2|nr:hypothetical protein [Sphingopyxis sp. SCN 67-31]
MADRYDDLLGTLRDLGVDTSEKGTLFRDAASSIGVSRTFRVPDRDAIIAEVNRQRERFPDRFGTVGKTREEFERQVATRFGGRARDMRTLERGSGFAGVLGGLGSGMTDPYNLATLPIGGGEAGLLKTILVEGIVGAGTEVLNLPATKRARDLMGENLTVGDATKQVLVSGGASAVLGGALKGVELAAPKIGAGGEVLRERLNSAILDNWDRLPEAVRSRLAGGKWDKLTPAQRDALRGSMTIADGALPDIAESLIGRGNMTAEERAAVDGLRREAEVAAGSPFKPGIVGDSVHAGEIDRRLAELLQPVERRPYRAIVPQDPVPTARGELMGGTSLSSGGTGARTAVKARIRQAESGGAANPDIARNPLSSATGRYQFTSGTWLAYYKRRFGSQGLNDAQILAKRSDGVLQETLMDDLTADNARFLRSVGEAETAGNLYLTHFAGQGGARKLFAADADALAADVLGASVVKANPWMRGMTAGDVIRWAHRKMSEPPPRRAGARAELAEDGGIDAVAAVQADIDRLNAEQDAARAVRDAESEQRIAAAIDQDIVPVDAGVPDIALLPPRGADAVDGLTDREMALVPQLRSEIAGTARLSDLKGIADRLDASEAEVRRALERIAATEKSLLVQRADGSFRRAPVDRAPVDAFRFIARAGGIADDEGHELIERFGIDAVQARTDPLTGKRVPAPRRQSVMVPAAGPLVRQGGMAIDRAGEMLFEAGYLRGAGGGRPTVAETLSYLERGMAGADARRDMVPLADLSTIDQWVAPETLADMRAHMLEWANYQDVDLTPDDVDALARLMLREDIANEDEALAALTHDAIVDALDDMRYESGDYDDAFARYLDSVEPDSGGERFAVDARDAREGGARGAPAGAVDVEDIASAADGNGIDDGLTAALSASVTHDMDALHGAGDGAAPDPVAFYLDENGDPRSWADIAAELDAEAAEIEAIKQCL